MYRGASKKSDPELSGWGVWVSDRLGSEINKGASKKSVPELSGWGLEDSDCEGIGVGVCVGVGIEMRVGGDGECEWHESSGSGCCSGDESNWIEMTGGGEGD